MDSRNRHRLAIAALVAAAAVACDRSTTALAPEGRDFVDAVSRAPSASASGVQALTTTQRSIEEFLAAQGTFVSAPPYNFVPWIAPAQRTGARADNLVIAVDYAGIAGKWLSQHGGPDVGTTFDGTVTERTLADGSAEIHVVLHTTNALTWGYGATGAEGFDAHPTGPELFGHTPDEILSGGDVALSDSHLEITFIAATPGAPLPDLIQAAQEFPVKDVFFRANGAGTLRAASGFPDGTAGRSHVVQNGTFQTRHMGATADGFPAERIMFLPVGR